MNDAGYTLSETLAAMAVISLAMGGLSLGLQVLGPLQGATGGLVAQLQANRTVRATVERLLARGAPFNAQDSTRLSGGAMEFQFACSAPQPCDVKLQPAANGNRLQIFDGWASKDVLLRPAGAARFVYGGSQAASNTWPPQGQGAGPALRSISLVRSSDAGDVAAFTAKVWSEQPSVCAFDAVMQGCR